MQWEALRANSRVCVLVLEQNHTELHLCSSDLQIREGMELWLLV